MNKENIDLVQLAQDPENFLINLFKDKQLLKDELFVKDIIYSLLMVNQQHYLPVFHKYIKFDEEWALKICKLSLDTYNYLPKDLRNDKSFALKLIDGNPELFLMLSVDLRNDVDISRQLVKNKVFHLNNLGENVANDYETMKAALKLKLSNINKVGKKLLENPKFIVDVLKDKSEDNINNSLLNNIPKKVFNNRDVAWQMWKSFSSFASDFVNPSLYFGDRELCEHVIKNNPYNGYMIVTKVYPDDRDFALLYIKQSNSTTVISYLSNVLMEDTDLIMNIFKRDDRKLDDLISENDFKKLIEKNSDFKNAYLENFKGTKIQSNGYQNKKILDDLIKYVEEAILKRDMDKGVIVHKSTLKF
jgi:hypothetical protein